MAFLEDLGTSYENDTLEAKEARGGLPKSLWETYSAFANTRGGTILLGVRELQSHELVAVGVDDPRGMVADFWNSVNNSQVVSENILTEEDVSIINEGSTSIVAITVPRASHTQRPVFIRENPFRGTFRRNGEGDYHCTTDEVRAMMRDAGSDAERAVAVEGFALDALCDETIERFRDELELKRPGHPWARLGKEDLLGRLGAAANDGKGVLRPTRAGLLVFGWEYEIVREFPFYFLDYREQTGERRWEDRVATNDGDWSGNVFDFWVRVSQKLTSNLKRPFQVGGDLMRTQATPLELGLREALANMLLHADYDAAMGSSVVVTGTSATFANSGTMLVPPEVAACGGSSRTRNPMVARMLSLVGIGEKAGSGFDAMRAGARWAGLPEPELRESFSPDRVNLEYPLKARAGAVDEPADNADRVTGLLRERGTLTRAQVESALGVSKATANNLLASLIARGLVERVGQGKATVYRLRR